MSSRLFDIIVLGASGYTGFLSAKYLVTNYPNIKIAIAGRNKEKLEKVQKELLALTANVPILLGDTDNYDSIQKITAQTKVIIAAAGPYLLHGDTTVKACLATGTDYCDVTGEYYWVRSIIDRYHQEAVEKGIKIVSFCGFDSVPSDLGVLFSIESAKKLHPKAEIISTHGCFKVKGGVSGGTLSTALVGAENGVVSKNPYYLCPSAETRRVKSNEEEPDLPIYVPELQKWSTPFFMATINMKTVRRSSVLLGYDNISYKENMVSPNILMAWLMTAPFFMMFSFVRSLLKRVFTAPGEGPDQNSRSASKFTSYFFTKAVENGKEFTLRTLVKGGDPYEETGKFVVECAVMLVESNDKKGGCLTPASAFGLPLIERLKKRKVAFEVDMDI